MEFTIVNLEPHQAIAIRDHSTASGLGKKYEEIYGELSAIVKKQGLKFKEHPFGLYHSFSQEDVDMEGGFVVDGDPKSEGRMHVMQTYSGKALRADYYGPYTEIQKGWDAAIEYAKENNLETMWPCFEIYVTDPSFEPDSSKWHTEIYLPIK